MGTIYIIEVNRFFMKLTQLSQHQSRSPKQCILYWYIFLLLVYTSSKYSIIKQPNAYDNRKEKNTL